MSLRRSSVSFPTVSTGRGSSGRSGRRGPAFLTNDINQADAVVAMRSTYQSQPRKLRDMAGRPVQTVVVKSNTFSQIATALDEIVKGTGDTPDEHAKALDDVQ